MHVTAHNNRRPSCKPAGIVDLRLRKNTVKPASPPGHQKATASNAEFDDVRRLDVCAVALRVSIVVTTALSPLRVTFVWAKEQVAFAGRFVQLSAILPLY